MNFQDVYARESEKAEEKNKNKKVISNDAYALGEAITNLTTEIRKLRLSK